MDRFDSTQVPSEDRCDACFYFKEWKSYCKKHKKNIGDMEEPCVDYLIDWSKLKHE